MQQLLIYKDAATLGAMRSVVDNGEGTKVHMNAMLTPAQRELVDHLKSAYPLIDSQGAVIRFIILDWCQSQIKKSEVAQKIQDVNEKAQVI